MMRTGYDATRRNRNQGTRARGHGQDNRMQIPTPGRGTWWEAVGTCTVERLPVHGRQVTFIVEETHPDYRHSCNVRDISRLLQLLPAMDLEDLTTFVFRQPTRKQQILAPNWGRLAHSAQLTLNGNPPVMMGPTIFLDAQLLHASFEWGKNLALEYQAELARLREDGHRIVERKRDWLIRSNEQATRSTQLFRTLLHEVGHWVDFLEKVERPSRENLDTYDVLFDRFHARPRSEREAFAHRYATEVANRLRNAGLIPFPPQSADAVAGE